MPQPRGSKAALWSAAVLALCSFASTATAREKAAPVRATADAGIRPAWSFWPRVKPDRDRSPQEEAKTRKELRVIVVDPGHGGIDSGAFANGVHEKMVTLDIALAVRRLLEQDGYRIRMSRDRDTDVSELYPSQLRTRHKRDLQNRLTLVRDSRAVGLLSIHANSSVNLSDRGPIVFYAIHSDSGKALATIVASALNQVAGSSQRPVGRKNLFLLRHAPCPAVLIEVGFLTNAVDAKRLSSDGYRIRLAEAIAKSASTALRDAPIPPPFERTHARLEKQDWIPPR